MILARFFAALGILTLVLATNSALASDGAAWALERRKGEVRVKLSSLSGAKAYRVQSDGGFKIENSNGDIEFETNTDEAFEILSGSNSALPEYYRIELRQFPIGEPEKEESRAAARHLAELYAEKRSGALALPLDVLEEPFRHPWSVKDRDPKSFFRVAAGKFPSRAMAEQALVMLGSEIESASIYKESLRPFPGLFKIRDSEGRVAGQCRAGSAIRPDDVEQTLALAESSLEFEPETEEDEPARFRGSLQLFRQKNGDVLPVNSVDLESYLNSVAPAEIGEFAPLEALKAQAVAARSEAIHKLNQGSRHGDDRYDFVSTQLDQVYRGAETEHAKSTRAVEETAGQAIVFEGKVIDAVYSHSCGGALAANEDVWGGQPIAYLRSKIDRANWVFPSNLSADSGMRKWLTTHPDVYCNPNRSGFPDYAERYFRWKKSYSGKTLSARINARGYRVGTLKSLRVVKRASSGRVRTLEIRGTKKTVRIENGDRMQTVLGIYSSAFVMDISKSDDRVSAVTFRGAGYGHGVGLCQMGAYMMAKHWKYSHTDILKHYFGPVEIVKLY